MIRSIRIRIIVVCVAVVCMAAVSSTTCLAQRAEPPVRFQVKKDFEVLSAIDAHVMTTEKCSGLKILTVFVPPVAANNVRMSSIAALIGSSYLSEIDLVVFFVADRRFRSVVHATTEKHRRGFASSVRGIYSRRADTSTTALKFLPAGLTEEAFEDAEN